ncbi:MAG: ABC transporter ATP-binding protein [Chloroflexota bacterium]|nr:ABC transporter ATP-binding protein [Chloroflexota bacterium]
MPALLEARHVSKVFGGGLFDKGGTVALEDFSFALQDAPPTVTAIVGESGSGKTTLARVLLGLTPPTTGAVLYRGKDVRRMSRGEYRTYLREVQVIFQDPYEVYNPFYNVDHVLETPIVKFGLAKSARERRELIEETLQAVGLRPEETLGRWPHQLSGGQRQRIMVARALLLRPKVIIADEPVSMVDASLRATILGSLSKLNQQYGISLIYITHDLTTAYQVSQNIIVLYRGAVVEAGNVEQVIQRPQHPYTQLLIGSIPLPDPKLPWAAARSPANIGAPTDRSCRFTSRCPYAMPMCIEKHPPLYQTNPDRVTACYLYRDAHPLQTDEVTSVFVGAALTGAALSNVGGAGSAGGSDGVGAIRGEESSLPPAGP